jgi:hypothetical protein
MGVRTGLVALSLVVTLPSCVTEILSPRCDNNVARFIPRQQFEDTSSEAERGRITRGEDMVFLVASASDDVSLSAAVNAPWPGGIIPYRLGPGLVEVAAAEYGVGRWNAVATQTGVSFRAHAGETDFVEFVSEEVGCFAAVGQHGGRQIVNLGGTCGAVAAVHEAGHSIGLVHEHQRHDRDEYIEVLWSNIDPNRTEGWVTLGYGAPTTSYDYYSIMHYRAWDGSINGAPVMRPLNASISLDQIGADDITQADIAGVQALYRDGAAALQDAGDCSATPLF